MLKREIYLSKIRDFYDERSLLKILYGMRRTGKSVILTQIMEEIRSKGVSDKNIIYINFESLDYSHLKTAKDLDVFIKNQTDNEEIYYLFFDEIQNIADFEIALNSLRVTDKYSIFVTGSNSRMTFKELSTDLSGRYVSFRINSLTFKEVVEITNTKKEDYEKLLFDVFEFGTLPQRFSFSKKESIANYISDVYDSIVLKDVVDRIGIKNLTLFNLIFQYLLQTEGKEFSAKNIINYLKSENRDIGNDTLYSYLDALCSTFILNKVYRYDISGKTVLKTLNKYYVSDLGIKTLKTNSKETNYSISIENIVFNDLISKGYEVYIGKTKKGEVDFVATKNGSFKYIQATYYLASEETIEREFGAYNSIQDNYEKYVVSLDKGDFSRNGIKHINLFKFLMSEDF
jgi:predicted AAA+ superfamily ATPase